MKAAGAWCLALAVLVGGLAVPPRPALPGGGMAPGINRQEGIPWQVKLGMRSMQLQGSLPVLNQVVLVPDAATYLDEIARWRPSARWPVLIEDDAFAPRFIRAFKPAAVFRRAPVGGTTASGAELRARIEGAVIAAWSPDATSITDALKQVGLTPQGLVLAAPDDPAWTAAVALAAGRGQQIGWLEGNYGTLNTVLNAEQFRALDGAVTEAFRQSGATWQGLGDDLDVLTICRTMAVRATVPNPPGGWDSRLPPRNDAPLAVTDVLCRDAKGARYAFAAQIPGDGMRAAYAAMCSLFLDRRTIWMFDGYADRATGGMFAEFGFTAIDGALQTQGYERVLFQGRDATAATWRSLLPKGVDADVVLVNSAGNADFFQIGQGSDLWSTNVPLLHRPVALSMVHSFSLQRPGDADSIGARWLEHGVYAYVGSVEEPYLMAFVPPRVMLTRAMQLVPFLVASRHWEGDVIPQPWRVATLGDPLMTIPPESIARQLPPRLAPEHVAEDAGALESGGATDRARERIDLRRLARRSLETARTNNDAALYADAMRALVLLGDDQVASQLYDIAASAGHGEVVASLVLGSAYRTGSRDRFMQAWGQLGRQQPSLEQRAMLWGLWANGLDRVDAGALAALKRAVRMPRADMDAELLLPVVKRVEGRDRAAQWLHDLILAEPSVEGKRRLAVLQGKL